MATFRTDEETEKDVKEKLIFEPQLDESKIHVSIKNGVITLLGTVNTYLEKCIAERAARNIEGVKAVANDLKVDISAKYIKTDTEIATVAVNVLKWDSAVPHDEVKVSVEDGCITLTGTVKWWHQSQSAERAVRNLPGVKSINNLITIDAGVTPTEIKKNIVQEFHRNAIIDAEKIKVKVEGSKVILRGQLHSWAEIKEAKRAAWSLPGVTQVEDHLTLA